MKKNIIFLDRDGVINIDKSYLYRWEDFEYSKGAINGLKFLAKFGFEFIIITNQSGIGRGFYSSKDFDDLSNKMINNLNDHNIRILDIFYCPHYFDGSISSSIKTCECRKPKPGLFYKARDLYSIDLESSIMVGDKPSDYKAALNAGIKKIYIIKSKYTDKSTLSSKIYLYQDLYEVSRSIIP